MGKPICKVDGMINFGGVCSKAGVQCGDDPTPCLSDNPDMCKHSSAWNPDLEPKPCPTCKTVDDLYLEHRGDDSWFVTCSLCSDSDELEPDEGCATKEEAISEWNKGNV